MKKILVLTTILANLAFGLTDMVGRDVDVSKADKLVFLGPGALRLGVYMGLEDKVVGIEKIEQKAVKVSPYRQVLAKKGTLKKPIIGQGGPGKMPSIEALIKSGASLIIGSFIDKAQVELIEQKTKIPVFMLSYGDGYGGGGEKRKLDAIKKSLQLLGKIAHKEQRAKALVEWMNKEETALKALKLSQKRIYVGGIGFKGPWGIESTEANFFPFTLLNVNPALKTKKEGHVFLDLETLVKLNPDVIFIDKLGMKQFKKQKETKMSVFANMKAFKNKEVYTLPPFNFYNTNVENSFLDAWVVASKLGAKVDIKKQKKRIFKIFFEQ